MSRKRGADPSPTSSAQRSRNSAAAGVFRSDASDASEQVPLAADTLFKFEKQQLEYRVQQQFSMYDQRFTAMQQCIKDMIAQSRIAQEAADKRLAEQVSATDQAKSELSVSSAHLRTVSQKLQSSEKDAEAARHRSSSVTSELNAMRHREHDSAEHSRRLRQELQDAETPAQNQSERFRREEHQAKI